RQVCRSKKPGTIIGRCESKWGRSDQLNFMMLILQLLAFRSRSLFQKCRAPFVDEPRCFFLAATKMEAAYEPWIAILDRCQSQEGMLRVELLDLLQCLGSR